jgi:uncharacterized protein YuzE
MGKQSTMLFSIGHLKGIKMEIKYFNETDTLLVVFNNHKIVETKDLNENTLMELDKDGKLVSLTIEHAKQMTNVLDFSFKQVQALVNI